MVDNKAPILKRLVLPSTVDFSTGPQTIEVLAEAEDGEGGSGIAYVSVWFDRELDFATGRSPLLLFGGRWSVDSFADDSPTIGSGLATLWQSTLAGTYNVTEVWVTDNAGNVAKYDAQQLRALGMPTAMTATGRPLDVTPPKLTGLSFPSTIDLSRGPVDMTFSAEASDEADGSGLDSVSIWLFDPLLSDGLRLPAITILNRNATNPERASSTIEVGQAANAGDYRISHVLVRDRAGNEQRYGFQDLEAMGIKTGFTVTGSVADTASPQLLDMWLPRTLSLQAGAEQSFAVMARDPGGLGVRSVIANLDRPLQTSDGPRTSFYVGQYASSDSFNDGTPDVGVDRFRLTAATEPGTYQVVSLYIADLAGNLRIYSGAELQALGINTAMTVLDKAPGASLTPSGSNGKLVLSLSAREWAAEGIDNFALTLDFDPATLRLVDAVVEGARGVAVSAVPQPMRDGRVTLTGRGELPADAVLKVILEPLAGKDSFQYAVESFRVNGVAQTFAGGNMESVRFGTDGDDRFDGAVGGFIDAGAGLDRVVLASPMPEYTIVRDGQGFVVQEKNGVRVSLAGVERLEFSFGGIALDIDGVAGQAYRLYQAAFDRKPDPAGVGFWLQKMDAGMSLAAVARAFLQSREFESRYGVEPSNEVFVTALYQNVLHRAPDAEGFEFWNKALRANFDRADLLAVFSESDENVAQVVASIDTGFVYYPPA